MAVKKCKECGQEIGTKASACPHCGAKDPLGRKKAGAMGCGGVLVLIFAFVVVVLLVALASDDKSPMPYKLGEVYELPPHKWQVDAVVEAPAGALEQAKLEALAKFIATQKEAALGKVGRWWVSYYLPGSNNRGPVAVIKWEGGKTEFKWVPRNYPPGFKGPAQTQGQ